MLRCLVLASLCIALAAAISVDDLECTRDNFDAFLAEHGRTYSPRTYNNRFANFCASLRSLQTIRALETTSEHVISEFADMSPEEFARNRLNGGLTAHPDDVVASCLKNNASSPELLDVNEAPASFDWRTKGAVRPVKNQEQCGSCWAFSTAANIEGQYFLKTGKSVDLSPQDLVDCSHDCSTEIFQGKNVSVCDSGCGGGWPWMAYETAKKEGGLDTWTSYPYTGTTGSTCKHKSTTATAPVQKFTCVSSDEKQIAAFLAKTGPLSIAVNAMPFMSYKSGVLSCQGQSKTMLDHAVLLVGYGTDAGQDYWIVKNSWGTSWGEEGYVRVARGTGACGINNAVSTADL